MGWGVGECTVKARDLRGSRNREFSGNKAKRFPVVLEGRGGIPGRGGVDDRTRGRCSGGNRGEVRKGN